MIAKENDESRRKREFINLIKLGCLRCQAPKKKKKIPVPIETYKEYIFNMHKESQELQNNK